MVGWDQLYLRKTKSQTSVSKWPTSPDKTKRKLSWKQSLTDFCRESSIHGIKYLVESDQHWMEKVFWVASLAFGKIPICPPMPQMGAQYVLHNPFCRTNTGYEIEL